MVALLKLAFAVLFPRLLDTNNKRLVLTVTTMCCHCKDSLSAAPRCALPPTMRPSSYRAVSLLGWTYPNLVDKTDCST